MADQVYWNNVKQGANFLFGTKSAPRRNSSGQKKVSVWDRYSSDKEKLAALRDKKKRCDGKWNAVKSFFGFGEKMTSKEMDTYYKLDSNERQRQISERMRKENPEFYNDFLNPRAGQWE